MFIDSEGSVWVVINDGTNFVTQREDFAVMAYLKTGGQLADHRCDANHLAREHLFVTWYLCSLWKTFDC